MTGKKHSLGNPSELAATYAAGSMTPAQAAAFEAHLAKGCPRCADELKQLDPVMAALFAGVQPVSVNPQIAKALAARIDAQPKTDSIPAASKTQVWRDWSGDDLAEEVVVRQAAGSGWESTGVEGVEIRRLFVDRQRNQMTALIRMAPGSAYPGHLHDGPEECLVLEGDLQAGEHALYAGDFERMGPGSHHGIQSTRNGCLLLIHSSLTDDIA